MSSFAMSFSALYLKQYFLFINMSSDIQTHWHPQLNVKSFPQLSITVCISCSRISLSISTSIEMRVTRFGPNLLISFQNCCGSLVSSCSIEALVPSNIFIYGVSQLYQIDVYCHSFIACNASFNLTI